MELIFLIFVVAGICALAGAAVASSKNAGGGGFMLGLLFGPLGVLISCFLDNRPRCIHCREGITEGANICPHCRNSVFWINGKQHSDQESAEKLKLEIQERRRIRIEQQKVIDERERLADEKAAEDLQKLVNLWKDRLKQVCVHTASIGRKWVRKAFQRSQP
ncbi:hypothetical protein SH661x_000881 [Planctomicrobium sp. SH661]|uniref:hypothetical protein n=1 Tax=Planctomicrobium sp. SH661 TaxID=3448124 RepID=UPI003F5C0533